MKWLKYLKSTNDAIWVTLVLIGATLAWELAVDLLKIKPILLPAPSAVLREAYQIYPWIAEQSVYTIMETLVGFGLAVAIGIVLALLIVSSKFIEVTVYTLLVAFNSIPKAALAPLFVVWMGTGVEPKIAMALFIAIFSIVVNTVQGLRSVEPEMLDLARSLGANRMRTLQKVQIFCALPSLFAGMKVGISLALVGAIIGEFIASSRGLGYIILVAQGEFNTPRIFAVIVVLAIIGTLLFFMIDLVERAILPWHVSRRRT